MFCMAVGNRMFQGYADDNAFAEAWNGASWKLLPVPQPGSAPVSLSSVACWSANDCVAVGPVSYSDENAIVEWWNGTNWRASRELRSSAGLYGIACPAVNDCIAVGAGPRAEKWDGTQWTRQHLPQTSALLGGYGANPFVGVSCGSPTQCVAVSDITAAWNGSSWKLDDQLVNLGIAFNAVSCASTASCLAVGVDSSLTQVSYRWNGSSWSVRRKFATPAGAGLFGVTSVSCVAPLTCIAVGFYGSETGPFPMLAERYQ
jgi:hypothetical protein